MTDKDKKNPDQIQKEPAIRTPKALIWWVLIIALFAFLLISLRSKVGTGGKEFTESELPELIKQGKIKQLLFVEDKIKVELKGGAEQGVDSFTVTTAAGLGQLKESLRYCLFSSTAACRASSLSGPGLGT